MKRKKRKRKRKPHRPTEPQTAAREKRRADTIVKFLVSENTDTGAASYVKTQRILAVLQTAGLQYFDQSILLALAKADAFDGGIGTRLEPPWRRLRTRVFTKLRLRNRRVGFRNTEIRAFERAGRAVGYESTYLEEDGL